MRAVQQQEILDAGELIISLGEEDYSYGRKHVLDHVDPALFEHFLIFSRHPLIHAEMLKCRAAIRSITEACEKSKAQLKEFAQYLLGVRENDLEQSQATIAAAVRAQTETELDESVRATTAKYHALLASGFRQVQAAHNQERAHVYGAFARGAEALVRGRQEAASSAKLFSDAVERLYGIFTNKFTTANVKGYCEEALAQQNRKLLRAALEFVGKHAASPELAGDPFLQFDENVTPADLLALARSVPDEDLLALFGQTLCAHGDFRGLRDAAGELDRLSFPDFPHRPRSKTTNLLLPTVLVQAEVQARWFADKNF